LAPQSYMASDVPRSKAGIWLMIKIPKLQFPTVHYMFTLCYR